MIDDTFETCIFLGCFCYFWKVKSLLILKLFIFEYLDKTLPWREIKEAFSVNLPSRTFVFA